MKAGDRVKTTPKFSKLFEGGAVWTGVLLKCNELEKHKTWRVRVDGIDKPQIIDEKFLKKETKR